MFRLIKIIFNAFLLVLAIIGFNAIGGQKYVEAVKVSVGNFIQEHALEGAKKIGNFSGLNEEFQIDNSVNLVGYKAVIAEHKASGQKMVIVDSGKKPLLTQNDIKSDKVDKKLNDLADKFKYQAVTVQDIKITDRGTMKVYGKDVPYAKFEAHVTKLPFKDVAGVVASVTTSDGSEKLAFSISEKKKYSQLITNEFYRGVAEGGENN
ncbi:TPA: hypothetical protein CPT95_06480 [Candidatus Gastranaerophilales bacterium HUM_15]|jgi:hypothetical protein|nr:unknown [Acinetobacter sp. CAG:196]DAA95230.1 MAG TPA: hypothetical protein CPT88_06830 [Candidatus Gastranaerophilales bacterium HUM_8]DAA97935.1 MAG TPA: hypothetical protein CPT96_11035 [Candidatus Gastranaerophilales bacterium HUM_10]DAB04779.1 MAG TPA: hypothetical protein CPT89_01225 [Candidatus Gastranaerophilales bacterium HUM_11]DAB08344.1 MAG TPA: hypothetical protein CPT95_06480 [Candidatus Gastranaerophilales bacterium HUM_15]DAB12888.1 MAG TPA: hypothetical protein CPT97_10350 